MPPVDVAALLEEDAQEEKQGVPFRFGFPHDVNYDLTNSGIWEDLADGSRVWRLAIKCPGAYSINIVYDLFDVPDGSRLFVYPGDRSMVLGAFGSHNNKEHGMFATSPTRGETCVLEYHVPPSADRTGQITISRIVHGYKDVFYNRPGKDITGFGDSGECNINVKCPEGEAWQNEVRSVAMIVTWDGTRLCSGALVNNVREDQTPYFLSANHCLGSESTWLVIFNYESPRCDNVDAVNWESVQGTTLRATNDYSDFALVELSEQPPDSYNVFYSGWDAIDTAADSSVAIHHPSGDIKKISLDFDPLVSTDYFLYVGESHWRVGAWELGATEGGSSGCPLFNYEHRIVAQLHGGQSACKRLKPDWFGKFSKSWDYTDQPSSRLMDWLDPDGTGTRSLDGLDPFKPSFVADVTIGNIPLLVNFTGSSPEPVDQWTYTFGDDESAFEQSPSHVYEAPGIYDITLETVTDGETHIKTRWNYVIALADSITADNITGEPYEEVEVEVYARNSFPLSSIVIPVEYGGDLPLVFDSFSTVGCRTEDFGTQGFAHQDPTNYRFTIEMLLPEPGTDELQPGTGPVAKLFFTIGSSTELDLLTVIELNGYESFLPEFKGSIINYSPITVSGSVSGPCCDGITGDVDGSGRNDILDILYFVEWMFKGGPWPSCLDELDVDGSDRVDILDLSYYIDWAFRGGPYPVDCP